MHLIRFAAVDPPMPNRVAGSPGRRCRPAQMTLVDGLDLPTLFGSTPGSTLPTRPTIARVDAVDRPTLHNSTSPTSTLASGATPAT